MTTPEERAAYKKRLEEARNKKDMTETVGEASREEAMSRERRKTLERARDKKAPLKTSDALLSDNFLRACIDRFEFRPEEELFQFVKEWNYAALKYIRWLEAEGFSRSQSVEILNAALERADMDLGRFPVC